MQARAKLLLVDDEPLVRRSMQKTLRRAGFVVETAGDCTEGLEVFQATHASDTPFDLAVLDIGMPGFEGSEKPEAGLELLSRLLAEAPDLPVVMLTAYDEVNKAKEAVTRGARAYCVKGREQGLVDLIKEILDS
jgi:DNA-binding NarL/FixJ family response regulator